MRSELFTAGVHDPCLWRCTRFEQAWCVCPQPAALWLRSSPQQLIPAVFPLTGDVVAEEDTSDAPDLEVVSVGRASTATTPAHREQTGPSKRRLSISRQSLVPPLKCTYILLTST